MGTFPGIPCSQARTLPQHWEVRAPGNPIPLPSPTTEQPLEEPNLSPRLSHPLGQDLDNNKATSQELQSS